MVKQKKAEQKKSEPKKIEPLAGEALSNRVKELANLSKEQKARACVYFSLNKNGAERVNMVQFLNALIDAEGIDLDHHRTYALTGKTNYEGMVFR